MAPAAVAATMLGEPLTLAGVCTVLGVVGGGINALNSKRRRTLARTRAHGLAARRAQGDHIIQQVDPYVRVFCASVQYVGERGAIIGMQQLNNTDAPHHRLDLPVEMPFLLDAMQADAFQAATFGFPEFMQNLDGPLDSLALCEIRIHADEGHDAAAELVIAEESGAPANCSDDGLFQPLDSVTSKRSIAVSVTDALAVAMRFSLPLLLDTIVVLKAGLTCLDRARLEKMLCRADDEECDVELMMLRDELADGAASQPTAATLTSLINQLKPFVWYWPEQLHTRAGGHDSQQHALRHFQLKYQQLQARQAGHSVS